MHAYCMPLHAFGWDALDHWSCHASASRRNDFSTHCQARAQCSHVSRMIAVLIVAEQICKGLVAFWIHAYICYNSLRRWRIVRTECWGHVQERNTEYCERKTEPILLDPVLKLVWHRSWATKSDHRRRWLRRDVTQCWNASKELPLNLVNLILNTSLLSM